MVCVKCKKEVPDGKYCNLCGADQDKTRKPLKRPNGTGSVYKLRDRRRRRPWVAAVVKGYGDEDGDTGRVIIGYYEKRTDALAALTPHVIEAITERYNYTLSRVYEALLKKPSFKKIGKSQKGVYTAAWKWLAPLHDKKMRLLRTSDYQEIIDKAEDEDKSFSFQAKIKGLISKLNDWAMENDIIGKNYAQFIEIEDDDRTEREIFDDEQMALLIKHKKEREAQIILALIFTGMRPGELAKVLKDERLDLKAGYLINGSKTRAGRNRIVPLCEFIQPIFAQAALAAKPGAPLFTSPTGGALNTQNFRMREFYPYLDKLGIMENPYDDEGKRKNEDPIKYKPYTCRHTFASLSNRAGVKKDILQKAIGHVVDSDVTDNTYIHQQVGEYTAEFSKLDVLATVLATAKK